MVAFITGGLNAYNNFAFYCENYFLGIDYLFSVALVEALEKLLLNLY